MIFWFSTLQNAPMMFLQFFQVFTSSSHKTQSLYRLPTDQLFKSGDSVFLMTTQDADDFIRVCDRSHKCSYLTEYHFAPQRLRYVHLKDFEQYSMKNLSVILSLR